MEDCLGLCDLTEEEILAIAEHQGLPEQAAIAYGQYTLQKDHGADKICRMIVEDIRAAQRTSDREHVRSLLHVLHHFLRAHPEAVPQQHPWHTVF